MSRKIRLWLKYHDYRWWRAKYREELNRHAITRHALHKALKREVGPVDE